MKELLFATHNANKAKEISRMLDGKTSVLTLDDAGVMVDIPETANTIEGNALIKAHFLHELTGKACFADDTGLEVAALGGAPGVFTARYAGDECDPERNMAKLLAALSGVADREASFRTVIAYVDQLGRETVFDGVCPGRIALAKHGTGGFGYDPVFEPMGFGGASFAEMSLDDKNKVSHRGKAVRQLVNFLSKL